MSVPQVRLAPDLIPRPPGRGHRYHLAAAGPAVTRGAPLRGLPCVDARARRHTKVFGVHLELYADRLVLPVPAGIGVAPPLQRSGVYVRGGGCTYPVASFEPTGVLEVHSDRQLKLQEVFTLWGQPLSRHALTDFHGPVAAFLAGRRWPGAPGTIPLKRHAEIVLEIGGYVPPHPRYTFPPGL